MEAIVADLLERIAALRSRKPRILVGIDGNCAAGKTSLAQALCQHLGCPVIHMDDFYLLPEQRTAERLAEPGGNVAYERFREQVLEPFKRGESACYQPYNCMTHSLGPRITVGVAPITIVEGSYSLHPQLRSFYDLSVFLHVSPEEQLRRIVERNHSVGIEPFQALWIPMEEQYFSRCNTRELSDVSFET